MQKVMQVKTNLVSRGLKLSHLRLVVALAKTGQISQAASELGLTQPAASRLTAEISRIVGHQIHRRTGKGVSLTTAGVALAERAQRALIELGEAARDLDEKASGRSGHVRIGSVTGPSIEHVLPVLREVRRHAPLVTVDVEVAPSNDLGGMLLDGRLDFTLARFPDNLDPAQFTGLPIGAEPISIIVRRGHPLSGHEPVRLDDMLRYDWVLPGAGAILRRAVARTLHSAGLPEPTPCVVTSSFLLTYGVVRESDALAPVASAVAEILRDMPDHPGEITTLRTQVPIEVETYLLLTRRGQTLTPAAQMVMNLIKKRVGARS